VLQDGAADPSSDRLDVRAAFDHGLTPTQNVFYDRIVVCRDVEVGWVGPTEKDSQEDAWTATNHSAEQRQGDGAIDLACPDLRRWWCRAVPFVVVARWLDWGFARGGLEEGRRLWFLQGDWPGVAGNLLSKTCPLRRWSRVP